MKCLSSNEMANCSCNGDGWDCAGSILARIGTLAGLTVATGGWAIAAALVLYAGSGVVVAVECAEWLAHFQE